MNATSRQFLGLLNKVVDKNHRRLNKNTRKLVNTFEAVISLNSVLLHENKGLREALKLKKRKRQPKKDIKNLLFAPDDPEGQGAIIFSPSKIRRARQIIKEQEAEQEAEEVRKQQVKLDRELKKKEQEAEKRKKAEDKKEKQAERLRQKEDKELQKLANQQLQTDARKQKQQEKEVLKQNKAPEGARIRARKRGKKDTSENDHLVDLLEALHPPGDFGTTYNSTEPLPPNLEADGFVLAKENDREEEGCQNGGRRPRRNYRRPRWLDDTET